MNALAALDHFIQYGGTFPLALKTSSPSPLYISLESEEDVIRVVKMDLIFNAMSTWYSKEQVDKHSYEMVNMFFAHIRKTLIAQCGVSEELYIIYEVSISPHERGNFVDFLDELQLGVDWDASLRLTKEHLSASVTQKLVLAEYDSEELNLVVEQAVQLTVDSLIDAIASASASATASALAVASAFASASCDGSAAVAANTMQRWVVSNAAGLAADRVLDTKRTAALAATDVVVIAEPVAPVAKAADDAAAQAAAAEAVADVADQTALEDAADAGDEAAPSGSGSASAFASTASAGLRQGKLPMSSRPSGKVPSKSERLFCALPVPALQPDVLLTQVDLLERVDSAVRDAYRGALSHSVASFVVDGLESGRLQGWHKFARCQPDDEDGASCGRVSHQHPFQCQKRGEFKACPPLDFIIQSADPAGKHVGKACSMGYIQLKHKGGGNFGRHNDERAKSGPLATSSYLLLVEVAGATGYAQVNHSVSATSHDCERQANGFKCQSSTHVKKPINKGGIAVLFERLAFNVSVCRCEANADKTTISADGSIHILDDTTTAIRAGHCAFALGTSLPTSCGLTDGPSVATFAAAQPHGALAITFMIKVASYDDAKGQLQIWMNGLAKMCVPTPEHVDRLTSSFFFVTDLTINMCYDKSEVASGHVLDEDDADRGRQNYAIATGHKRNLDTLVADMAAATSASGASQMPPNHEQRRSKKASADSFDVICINCRQIGKRAKLVSNGKTQSWTCNNSKQGCRKVMVHNHVRCMRIAQRCECDTNL